MRRLLFSQCGSKREQEGMDPKQSYGSEDAGGEENMKYYQCAMPSIWEDKEILEAIKDLGHGAIRHSVWEATRNYISSIP